MSAELRTDGIYRDPVVGRWTRLGLAAFAVLAVFCVVAVHSSLLAAGVLLVIAVLLLLVRSRLGRPRLIVRPTGIVVQRYVGSVSLAWADVAWAGGVPAPPPLGRVEQVLAVRGQDGRLARVTSLRDAIDRRSGVAPRVQELASALLARAAWSTADTSAAD